MDMRLQRSLFIAAIILLGSSVSGCAATQRTVPAGIPTRIASSIDNGCASGGPIPQSSPTPPVVLGQPSTGRGVTPSTCPSTAPGTSDTIGVDAPATQSTSSAVFAGDFGAAWVVKGASNTYFFQPGSILSYANNQLIVRSYNSLFILPAANVQQVRQLSESSTTSHALASFAGEGNQSLLAALANAPAMTNPPGACADCAYPVALSYGTDQPFGPEPVQGPPAVTIDSSNASSATTCGPGQCGGTLVALTDVASDASTANATLTTGPASCFPSTYVFEVEAGACVPPPAISLSSTKRRTSAVSTRDDYRWGFWNRRTVLQCTWAGYPSPATAIYEYFDLDGYYSGPNYGHFLAPAPTNIQFRYTPSYTPFSFSESWFEDFNQRFYLRSTCWGFPARITWNA
jgi:hypothetical protein